MRLLVITFAAAVVILTVFAYIALARTRQRRSDELEMKLRWWRERAEINQRNAKVFQFQHREDRKRLSIQQRVRDINPRPFTPHDAA